MTLDGFPPRQPTVGATITTTTSEITDQTAATTTTASIPLIGTNQTASTDPILANLWTQLDRVQPTIPDRLSIAILEGAGIRMENSDPRLARLVSFAGQKFLTDIITDAMLHWRIANGQPTGLLSHSNHVPVSATGSTPSANLNGTTGSNNSAVLQSPPPPTGPKTPVQGTNKSSTERRATLTLDDLIASLNDRGIHVARPPYYR